MKKTLSDFPTYTDAKDKLDSIEKAHSELLAEREGVVRRFAAHNDIEAAVGELVSTGTLVEKAPPGQQLAEVDKKIQVYTQAIELQRAEVEAARSRASLEICQQVRPSFIAQIEAILKALKQICSANERLGRLRGELEADGAQTGSIPHCTFPGVGSWSDRLNLGSAIMFQESIKKSFPDVKL